MPGRRVLAVGVDRYDFKPLKNCVNDAEEVAGVLAMKEYGFDVRTLLDDKAVRRSVLSALSDAFSGNPEFVVFYFAGHGASTPTGTYLVTVDADEIEVGVHLDHLRRLMTSVPATDIATLVILDCCHSGAASPRGNRGFETREASYRDIHEHLHALGAGKVVLAACQPHELAYEEPSLRHGVFTHFLLEGLYGEAADSQGEVTIPNLYEYVSKKFQTAIGQTPVFKGDIAGRIVLGRNLTPHDRLSILDEEARDADVTSQTLMNEYIQAVSVDIETWKAKAYRDACSMLVPRLRWFERESEKHPRLNARPAFASAYSTARSKLAELAHLMPELETKLGTVKERLGAGTFGTVWRVHPAEGTDLAYKVYHPNDLENLDKLARFGRGYRAMAQLDHPHIVRVRDLTECPIGFIMDFIDGPNLRDYVALGHFPAEIARQLLTVGETLKHSHGRGVIHRDVKPENIIMHCEPASVCYRPYLTDFDLAWFSTATQFTREGFGSLIYAAPEQLAKPKSAVAHAVTTDVYAFGQLCFFFVCRRDPVPLLADNVRALREEVRSWGLEEPAHDIVELYEVCTQQRPEDRIQDFRDICDRLFEIEQLLCESNHAATIGFSRFARQLGFSVVGLSPERIVSDDTFLTSSGQTLVSVSAADEDSAWTEIRLCLRAQMPPTMPGASHRDARETVNRRIDSVLSRFSQASRRAGKQGPFETFIHVANVPMNIDGVEICRQITMRVVDCIESVFAPQL